MLLKGDIDWVKLGNVYNTKELKPEWKARKLVRQQIVQEMTTEALKEITEKHLDSDGAIKTRKLILDGAIEDKNWNAANKALDAFDSKLDLNPNKVITTKQIEGDMSHLLPDNTTGKLKAKQKQVTEGSRVSIDGDGDSD